MNRIGILQSLKENAAARGRNDAHGFLHIPKTAGSFMLDVFEEREAAGETVPVLLHHPWTLADVINFYPRMKVSFILRDPVERAVSGFLSRMRMGRPRYNKLWTPAEAIAFQFFHTPAALLRALISDDDRLQSAALFAMDSIRLLRLNYVYYFGSVEKVMCYQQVIANIGDFSDVPKFVTEFSELTNFTLTDDVVDRPPVHANAVSSASVLEELSSSERERVRDAFVEEYRIYDCLMQLRE